MTLAAHQLELLAPARSLEIGLEAVKHGADAVYIGGPDFGARTQASNSVRDIAQLVQYAHRFRTRIFVTLNTILRDDELEPAQRLIKQLYEAGVDAMIVQDMGLLELDLPPIQLHASTQCDIRTPQKARFLQDVGFSQIVLARELSLAQIADIHAVMDPQRGALEYFVHGALCVAYSGQCFISHAHTGRSANRGDCSQACRLPYTVVNGAGAIVAHEKHVLSMKDNNQSANLAALVHAGVRSFKIEGRYKDKAYVKNITAHYRLLLDALLTERPELAAASSGTTRFSFTPNPEQNFNRQATDYFVHGRADDVSAIVAMDTPKHSGTPIGWVSKVGADYFEAQLNKPISNGDGFTYLDLQRELVGIPANRVESVKKAGRIPRSSGVDAGASPEVEQTWKIFPKDPVASYKDLRIGAELSRNRDRQWLREMERESSERRISIWMTLRESAGGLELQLTDEDGYQASAHLAIAPQDKQQAQHMEQNRASLMKQLQRLGATDFEALAVQIEAAAASYFVPASQLNQLRRSAIAALQEVRQKGYERPARAVALEPPALYPDDSLSYLANVYNHKAHDFYAKHGVKVIDAAYESHEELGEVSLMITKHCVRFSLSLCPKQAKGVTGVQGTVRAEPLTLLNGSEKLTLRFDCKPCEMHVIGKMKKQVLTQLTKEAHTAPLRFYKTRP